MTARADPRSTEAQVLAIVDKGGQIPPDLLKKLAAKIGKGQTKSRGRDVTDTTEAEYAEMMSKFTPEQARALKGAITDYTQSSTAVNNHARGIGDQDEQKKMEGVDKLFDAFDQKGFTDKNRITYRLTTYKQGQQVPYGDKIKVGDFIMDKAFVSASENRQLLVQGVKDAKPGTRYVKFTIIGAGGANISGGSLYTNENEKAMHNMSTPKESIGKKMNRAFGTAAAGQAEILYRRNSVFRVDSITPEGNDLHVVVTAAPPEEAKGKLKNSFTGGDTSIA